MWLSQTRVRIARQDQDNRQILVREACILALVGDGGVSRVRDVAGGLSKVRGQGVAGALGRREETTDDPLSLIPCSGGTEGCRGVVGWDGVCFPDELGERVSFGAKRGNLPEPESGPPRAPIRRTASRSSWMASTQSGVATRTPSIIS